MGSSSIMHFRVFLIGILLPLLICYSATATALDQLLELNEENGEEMLIDYNDNNDEVGSGEQNNRDNRRRYGSNNIRGLRPAYHAYKYEKKSKKKYYGYGKGKGYVGGKGYGNGKGKGKGYAPPINGKGNTGNGDDELLDIPQTAIENGSFETLVTALTVTGLVRPLSAPHGPYTVFAPVDAAFEALPDGLLECLLDDPATLRKVLLYHIVKGKVTSDQLYDRQGIRTYQGEYVKVSINSANETTTVSINESKVIIPDVMASNGVIHVIDAVLVPEGIGNVEYYISRCNAKQEQQQQQQQQQQQNGAYGRAYRANNGKGYGKGYGGGRGRGKGYGKGKGYSF